MNIYKNAQNNINEHRVKSEESAERAYTAAMEIPEFFAAQSEYLSLLPKISKCEALGNNDNELKNRFNRAVSKRKEVINKYGINEEDFLPDYFCKKCNDRGYVDGKACICLKQQINSLITKQFGAVNLCSFDESCKLDNPVLKKQLSDVYNKMRQYCQKFPDTKYITHLFKGNPGTGKTQLASCIADSVMKKGYTVIFITAFKLNEIFKSYHFDFKGEGGELLENLYLCDLLVIDDLGTENKLNNITAEYLLSLMSERLHNRRHSIITTNLNDSMLDERYGGRLISRLADKSNSYIFNFYGEDLRQL